MTTEVLVTIIIAFLGSNGLWALIQSIYNKKDKTQDKLDLINEKVDKINYKVDTSNATLARTHILRFSDELINGIDHSNEYFKQTLQDIDTYEIFCGDTESRFLTNLGSIPFSGGSGQTKD